MPCVSCRGDERNCICDASECTPLTCKCLMYCNTCIPIIKRIGLLAYCADRWNKLHAECEICKAQQARLANHNARLYNSQVDQEKKRREEQERQEKERYETLLREERARSQRLQMERDRVQFITTNAYGVPVLRTIQATPSSSPIGTVSYSQMYPPFYPGPMISSIYGVPVVGYPGDYQQMARLARRDPLQPIPGYDKK